MAADNATAGTLDFSEDEPRSEILPLLSETLGNYAQQSEQAANMDGAAEQTGQPVPELTGPGTIASETGEMAAPPIPGVVQEAPLPNVALADQKRVAPPMMRPQAETQAAEGDYAQSENQLQSANKLARKAEAENSQAAMQDAAEIQPFLEQQGKLEAQKVTAIDHANNFLTNLQQQTLAQTDEDIRQEEALAKKNPSDWYGNHTTLQAIGAIIGIIGAGMSGQDTMAYVDRLINKDIAEHNRKGESLRKIQALHGKRYTQGLNIYKNASEGIETRYLTSLKLIKTQMEAKRNQSSNLRIQANYDKAIADLDTKYADGLAKLNNQKITTRIHEEQNAIDIARLGLERERLNQAKEKQEKGPEDSSVPFNITRAIDPNGPRGVPKNLSIPVKKTVDTAVNALNSTAAIRKTIEAFRGDREGLLHALKTSEPFRMQLYAASRAISGAGANLTGKEEAQVDGMAIVLKDLATGELGGVDELEKLGAIEEMISNSASQAVLGNAPNLEIDPNSIVGQVQARKRSREQESDAEVEQVQQAMSKGSPIQQHAALVMLAKNGNKAAKAKLSKEGVKGKIGQVLKALHIGGGE